MGEKFREIWKNLDDTITKIWKAAHKRWKIILTIISAGLSVVLALITQNIMLTISFIIVTAIIDLLVELYEDIKFDFFVKRIFEMKRKNRYILFIMFAIIPACCGLCELLYRNQIGNKDLFIQVCGNLSTNCLGAFIVCFTVEHIIEFDYKYITENLIRSRKDVYSTFLKIAFFACFINAVNFDINSVMPYMNRANKFYLGFITFYGMLMIYTFALRLIDKTAFGYTIYKLYPKRVLGCAVVFLILCNVFDLISYGRNLRPILLLLNTITVCIVAIGILCLLSRRAENTPDSYPGVLLSIFVLVMGSNCVIGFRNAEVNNLAGQVISGGVILVVTLALVLYSIKKQNTVL